MAMPIKMVDMIKMSVLMALISGVTEVLSSPNTNTGSVVEPTPERKKVTTKSSRESVKASSPPEITPGKIKGNVIRQINQLTRSEEHTSELQSRFDLVCRLLLEIGRASCRERV